MRTAEQGRRNTGAIAENLKRFPPESGARLVLKPWVYSSLKSGLGYATAEKEPAAAREPRPGES